MQLEHQGTLLPGNMFSQAVLQPGVDVVLVEMDQFVQPMDHLLFRGEGKQGRVITSLADLQFFNDMQQVNDSVTRVLLSIRLLIPGNG